MTKLAPEWVRTSDPVIRSPARYQGLRRPATLEVRGILDAESVVFGRQFQAAALCTFAWMIPSHDDQRRGHDIRIGVRELRRVENERFLRSL